MKNLVLLIALSSPLHSEILAHFQTTRGEIVAELQYDKVPQTVANFITLAQGTRAWVDPATGAVKKGPFYDGTMIHRTGNVGVYQFAQGGSRLGDGSDDPGFTIKDEFHQALQHTPYALSMGNAGPNTNGAGFFFTGNVSIPRYDGSYSLFGYVLEPASRAVVDAMITAGPNETGIISVTIERTDEAALAFDEQAQVLPVVTPSIGSLEVTPGVSAVWRLADSISTGSILRAFRSLDLSQNSWTEVAGGPLHVGISPAMLTPVVVSANLDTASAPTAFYQISQATHPDSYAPSDLFSRTIVIDAGSGTLSYSHVSSGQGGVATFSPYGGGLPINSLFDTLDFTSSAHGFTFIVYNRNFNPAYLLISVGCDTLAPTQVDGHHTTRARNNLQVGDWQDFAAGQAALSR